jgi:probable phosphomutase (TIGR03848 family)
MTTLFLIRHAANDFVKEGKLAGRLPAIHLNDEGRQQAERMAARMAQVKLDAIYSSPLERAVETADYIAKPHELAIQTRQGLNEIDCGTWTEQKIDDLSKTDGWRMFQVYPSGARPPDGESGSQMQVRAVREVEALCAAHPEGAIAIVSHADPIKAIVAHYAGLHLDLFQRLIVSPASVTVIWTGPWGPRLVRFNDAGPLEDIQPPKPAEKPAPEKKEG